MLCDKEQASFFSKVMLNVATPLPPETTDYLIQHVKKNCEIQHEKNIMQLQVMLCIHRDMIGYRFHAVVVLFA